MGKANNLKVRVASYAQRSNRLGPRTSLLISKVAKVDYILVASEVEALLLEANLIKKYEPPFNVRWMDGKAYPFIKITIKEQFPAVLQARKLDDADTLFFGPFPNIGDVRRILKWARRVFPYQSVKNHPKRRCLYYHLSLCPCPPLLSKEELTKYKRSMRYLIAFLQGKKESVYQKLAKEMKQAAKQEDFEEAAKIKQQLETLLLITSPFRHPTAYIDNPNLLSDEIHMDLESLRKVLFEHDLIVDNLLRIECYDISNIGGKEATGSMVVAIDGQIDKSQYRRFRIRFKNTPDDVAMMKEVVTRRLTHKEWPLPNLIVVDGGINQVNAVYPLVHNQYTGIPVIGLAKRLEQIVLASQGDTLRGKISIRLAKNHRALKLLQRLRDEAHRFALAYHRKLRRKNLLKLT